LLEDIESLIRKIEASPHAETRETARRLTQALLEFHGEAFRRVCEALKAAGQESMLSEMAAEKTIAAALSLHGLHPVATRERILNALRQVRPSLQAHGGDVELISIEEGTARLRLNGSCRGCPSSTETMRNLIREAVLREAPEVAELEMA
jgi:Fe-S cluster biogenesis protein NfuA